MERKKSVLTTLFILISGITLGQNNKTIYKAYASGNMTRWKWAMDSVDAIKQKTNKEVLDLVNYQYGYIAWCISNDKDDEAEKYLKKATDNLVKLEQKKYNVSMLYAYKAAFVGFEIGLAQYKAPFIGSKSIEYAKKSISTDASNALGYIQMGNIAYYTPSVFGGSKTEALEHYLKAKKIMESSSEYTTSNWNYLNLMATLISIYMDLKHYMAAKNYCLKALALEPGFEWVKNDLYPLVLKKMQ